MHNTSLRVLRNTKLFDLYQNLLLGEPLYPNEKEALLKIAVILINGECQETRELGYRMVVIYCNQYDDYIPLYDIAINWGFTPIQKSAEVSLGIDADTNKSFFNTYLAAASENLKVDGIYVTEQQYELADFFESNSTSSVAIVAPTSYGKSDLIIKHCQRNRNLNTCILVPTKALLAQTKRRLLDGLDRDDDRKIITHPEMYAEGDANLLAVLTQERLLRLMQQNQEVQFDVVFVDEAHNLLERDERNILLATVLLLLENKNPQVNFKFLTPFLVNPSNLLAKYSDYTPNSFRIDEHLKTERYYLVDFRKAGLLQHYDQYFDQFTDLVEEQFVDEFDFVRRQSAGKNIVYLNSKKKLVQFASILASRQPLLENHKIEQICEEISSFLHEEYSLVECLKRGVAYHHGSVPDIVKLFIEHEFSIRPELQFIVTTSTLLEGVNIPAEKLFVFEAKKGPRNLTQAQFKNLVGRVCRFREIFHSESGSLTLLEPEIYVVGSRFSGERANLEQFIRNSAKADKAIKEDAQNVLLKNVEITDGNREEFEQVGELLENLSPGLTGADVTYARTDIGRYCFSNNVSELDILVCEEEMDRVVSQILPNSINTAEDVLYWMAKIFIRHVREAGAFAGLERMKRESARKFYAMFLRWRMKSASYSEMIERFLRYWDSEVIDPIVYVSSWGDTTKGGHREYWVDIRQKTPKEKVNLAIVRIKEEQDFVDHRLIKFIEIMNSLGLLEEELYLKIKYGTADKARITMINNGINNHLANVLLDTYSDYVAVDTARNTVEIDGRVISKMADNGENAILIFEAQFHTRS